LYGVPSVLRRTRGRFKLGRFSIAIVEFSF
jgi:hypothetical protein